MRKVVALALAAGVSLSLGCGRRIEVKGDVKVEVPPYQNWPEEPTFEVIPGTGITCLKAYQGKPVGPDYDICKVGIRWYWAHKGHWFYNRKSWRGPWKPARRIPKNFLKIPTGHPKHRLAKLHPDYKK
jgi:hypothetical protein